MLTAKQEEFCQAIADGMTQADAYRTAYNAVNMKSASIHKRASELMADGEIAGRVEELRAMLTAQALWTREDSVRELSGIATDRTGETKPSERVSAIKELNAMHGYNAPSKVDLLSSDGSMSPPKRVEISFVNAASQATE